MKTKHLFPIIPASFFVATLSAAPFFLPVTYQGRLDQTGAVANGSFELQVGLFNAASGGSPVQLLTNNITVSNGLFTTVLQLDGTQLQDANTDWLELGVRTNGSTAAFTILTPRQQLTYAPLAARADVAGIANDFPQGAVSSYHILDGSIEALDIDSGQVVKSLNGLADTVTLAAGAGITITPVGNTLTISNTGWKLNGNAGTTAGTHFLGTTDNQTLEFRVSNQRRLQLDTNVNVLAGSFLNQIGPTGVNYSAILSGIDNQIRASSTSSVIAGGNNNAITNGIDAVISGGLNNYVEGNFATVGGGSDNSATSDRATVAGGSGNEAGWDSSFIGGGTDNSARNGGAAIVGGNRNANASPDGFIGAGASNNIANATSAVVAGGDANQIAFAADYAAIPGGQANRVGGAYGFAAGRRAKANHAGTFVWADSQNADFTSTAINQFLIRASGGVGINKTNPTAALDIGGNPGTDGVRFPNGTLQTTAPIPLFTSGEGLNPRTTNQFLAATVTVTVNSSIQRIFVTSHKALGTVSAAGAGNLDLYIGYRSSGSTASPVPVGNGILDNRVSQNTRITMGFSAMITGLLPGNYEVGLMGVSSDAANWNNNEWSYTTATVY